MATPRCTGVYSCNTFAHYGNPLLYRCTAVQLQHKCTVWQPLCCRGVYLQLQHICTVRQLLAVQVYMYSCNIYAQYGNPLLHRCPCTAATHMHSTATPLVTAIEEGLPRKALRIALTYTISTYKCILHKPRACACSGEPPSSSPQDPFTISKGGATSITCIASRLLLRA
jgi:hypothetical protein